MLIGYARVSALDQHLNLQLAALTAAGCEQIFTEKMSGSKARPGLGEAPALLRSGDALVVWKLDRLGCRTVQLLQLIEALNAHGIGFKSLRNAIDTTPRSPSGSAHQHRNPPMPRDLPEARGDIPSPVCLDLARERPPVARRPGCSHTRSRPAILPPEEEA